MVTRLYFHNALSTVAGTLPTTEQSTLTADAQADDATVSHSMNTTIGTSQVALSIPQSSTGATYTYYFTRFISPLLNQTSIAAGTWTFAFAASQGNALNNFPVDGSNKPIKVNCYVWKPSNATKYGTILDGNTASTVDEPTTAPIAEYYHIVNFTGSAVSALTAVDAVLVLEVWFRVTATNGASGSNSFFFDGPNVLSENALALSADAASYLETAQTLTFIQGTLVQRAPASQTISITESAVRTVTRQTRQLTTGETVVITESLVRQPSTLPKNIHASLTESVSLSDSATKLLTRVIPLNIVKLVPGEDTHVSDYAECHYESGTIIYTGDSSYMRP